MSDTFDRYEDVRAEILANPKVRAAYEAMQPAYQRMRLRLLRRLAQQAIAQGANGHPEGPLNPGFPPSRE